MRNLIHTATPSLAAIKAGDVSLSGSTGGVLDRSLVGLRNLVDRSLTEVRIAAGLPLQHRLCGLPIGDTETMFRPFMQAGMDRTGLGLGLSISRLSVEANGGLIRVRDVPDSGCVFTIELPRHALHDPRSVAAAVVS